MATKKSKRSHSKKKVTATFDSVQRFINTTAHSGWIQQRNVICKLAELAGLDPTTVVIQAVPPHSEKDVNV